MHQWPAFVVCRGETNWDLSVSRAVARQVSCLPLMDDALYPVMSPAFWAAHGQPDTPRDLLRLRLLHDRDPNASWTVWRKHHGPKALDTRIGPRLTSSDLMIRGAEHGLGVALARHRLASDSIRSGALLRPFGDVRVPLPHAYWIVISDTAGMREAVRPVVDWLEAEASKPPDRPIADQDHPIVDSSEP